MIAVMKMQPAQIRMWIFKPFAIACTLSFGAQAARTEPLLCKETEVTVSAATPELQERVCESTRRAIVFLRECNIVVSEHIWIDVLDTLPENYFGLYHNGKKQINLLSPDDTGAMRKPDSAFFDIPVEQFFDSIVVHELTHAAFDKVPCHASTCLATAEYVAYTMQIMSLSPANKKIFEAHMDMGTRVTRDEINAIILMLAPDRFTQRAWAHLSQRENSCDYIGLIMQGNISFDREGL